MLIPLGTDRPHERKPIVTRVLIALNVGVFVMMAVLTNADPELAARIQDLGAVGRTGHHHQFQLWQPVTSAFFHGGFMHIFGNMIFLLVFGPPVEDRFGKVGYIAFFLAGAIISAMAHMGVSPAPAIGASGAVAAVSGAFLVLFPRTRIKCFVIFLIIGVFMIPSWWLIGMFVILDLVAQVFSSENGIANMAHLGGYGFGIGVAFFLLLTGIIKREPYDLFSLLKHRQRRKAFQSAHRMHEQGMAKVLREAAPVDPRAAHIARARAEIGTLLSDGKPGEAADAYLRLVDEFGHDERAPLTLHRDGQYQIANTLYQRGDRVQASEAFSRLLASYPNDPERKVISVLIARTRADDQGDVPGAITMLEELLEQSLDNDTKALVEGELDRIKDSTTDNNEGTPQ